MTANQTTQYDNIYIGSCSWRYDSWKGLIYNPDKTYKSADYLPDYAKLFNTVEIDHWFWSLFPNDIKLPTLNEVKTYNESVPDDFLFSVKVPNALTLTHYYANQPATYKQFSNQPNDHFLNIDLLNKFLDIIEPLKAKLGPVMFQFEYLNKQKMASQKQFLDTLAEFFAKAPADFDYGIEIRNPNYLNKQYSEFLKQSNISPVLTEGYYIPPIAEAADKINLSTGNSLVVRLQGPDRQGIEKQTGNKWSKIVSPQDHSLNSVAGMIKKNIGLIKRILVNINNHYEGSACHTAWKLQDMLNDGKASNHNKPDWSLF